MYKRQPSGTANIVQEGLGDGRSLLTVHIAYRAAFGMGEKYNAVNQKGRTAVNRVEEKFCFQGEKTYCPAQMCIRDSGCATGR